MQAWMGKQVQAKQQVQPETSFPHNSSRMSGNLGNRLDVAQALKTCGSDRCPSKRLVACVHRQPPASSGHSRIQVLKIECRAGELPTGNLDANPNDHERTSIAPPPIVPPRPRPPPCLSRRRYVCPLLDSTSNRQVEVIVNTVPRSSPRCPSRCRSSCRIHTRWSFRYPPPPPPRPNPRCWAFAKT